MKDQRETRRVASKHQGPSARPPRPPLARGRRVRRSRAATGGDRRNYRALALAFALGCLLPIVVQGLALFVASFHSQLVLVTSIFLIGTGL